MNIAIPADHRVNIKENKDIEKFLDLPKDLKMLWNMNVNVILIVVGVLGTVHKILLKKIKGTGNQWENRNHVD